MPYLKSNPRYLLIVGILTASIGLVVVLLRIDNRGLVVEMTHNELIVDGNVVSELIVNPKDGYPDFPEAAYDNFQVLPLRNAIAGFAKDSTKSLRIIVPDTFWFGIWKPIIITAQKSGFQALSIECGREKNPLELLYKAKTNSLPINLIDTFETSQALAYIYLDHDSIIARRSDSWSFSPSKVVNSKQDSIINAFFYANEARNRIAAIAMQYSISELAGFVSALEKLTKSSERIDLGVLPSASCIEIVRFVTKFDSIRKYEGVFLNRLKFQDGFLKYGV